MVFEAPDGPLGLILAASWANLVPKWGAKMGNQSAADRYQKMHFISYTQSNNHLHWFNFWFLFGLVLVQILEPILNPKIGPKFVNFWVQFWISFFWGFGALWVPLGSLLGPLEALLGGLWTQKRVKTKCFLRVMKRLFFGL